MLLGDVPVTGNYFFLPEDFPSEADQMRALRGDLVRRTAGPGDVRYIQGAGPIRLGPQETHDLWVAVVAGESRAQLVANARAAEADVAERLTEPLAEEAVNPLRAPEAIPSTGRMIAHPGCKGCKPR
jgi:hypothetical protein